MSGGGGTQVIQPVQKTYGEGMAEALKAQVDLLTGKGDFAEVAPGGLEGLLPMEERVRQKTAQMDTDVLQRTLLGSVEGAQKGTYDDEGRLVVGYEGADLGGPRLHTVEKPRVEISSTPPQYDTATGGYIHMVKFMDDSLRQNGMEPVVKSIRVRTPDKNPPDPNKPMTSIDGFNYQPGQAISEHISIRPRNAKPIYARDAKGEIITDKSKAGQEVDDPGTRAGDGMIDLLGDSRNISATQADVDAGLASFVGEERKAGFDKDGNFLGLAALSEDIQRGNLARQREGDLADVERLSERYQDVMADYKPAATEGLQDARDLLAAQKDSMTTGGGAITVPTADTFGGDVTGATMNAAQVADPLQLQANTQFQGELGSGGQDTIRSALLGQARTALDEGLTDRERRSIEQASRARQTATGRIFDPSATVQEAQAVIEGDRNRQMQNRAFAQSVMGQEAGLQQGDITRGMAQESEQAGLQQRADLAQAQMDQQAAAFGADASQRAGLANQAQRQQANQFGVGATMDAERLNETLGQQGLANYINAVGNLARMEDQFMLDPFQALLGRGGGGSLQAGQSVFGQAGYGLNSSPQYINPEAGLGYLSNQFANQANMYGAQVAANANRDAGLLGGIGAIGGGIMQGLFCWVAREVYGPTNPAWLLFREWMLNESPNWFFNLYLNYGEKFASWISDKPMIKAIIRKWMDSKIREV